MQCFAINITLMLCVAFSGSTHCLEIEREIQRNFKMKEYINKRFDRLEERHQMEIKEIQDKYTEQLEKVVESHKLEMKNMQDVYNAKLEKMEVDIEYLKEEMLTESENRVINQNQGKERMGYSETNISVANSPASSKKFRQFIEKEEKTDWSVVSENIVNAEEDHEQPKTMIKKRQVQSGTRVAFFASLTNDTEHLGANQDIVFDNAVTNIGNAYHPNHGTFIAPVAGVYVFTATLVLYSNRSWGHFMKNRQVLAKFDFGEAKDSASQTIIVELDKNDEVFVQNTYLDRAFIGDRYSTFAGFLLYEHTDDTEIVGK